MNEEGKGGEEEMGRREYLREEEKNRREEEENRRFGGKKGSGEYKMRRGEGRGEKEIRRRGEYRI